MLQHGIWLKIMFYPPPEIQKSPIRFSQLFIKTLPGFCCLVAQSCLTPCDPINFSMPRFPVRPHPLKLAQTHSIGLLMPSNHLILCHAFCSCLQYFPGSRVWFGFVLSSQWVDSSHQEAKVLELQHQFSTEYSGLISLRIDRLDLLAVQRTLKSLLHSPAPQFEKISSSALSLLYGAAPPAVPDYWKNHSFDFMDICWQSNVSFF